MDFFEKLKACEPCITQIAKDAGISRQAVNGYRHGALPNRTVFDRLLSQEKYSALRVFEFETLRAIKPVGRPVGSKKKPE